uniref:Cytochrome c biogenesis protein CcsA n=1 Tax=Porphyridium sordidum TaxID=28024 RepID=A0A1C9CDM3_PORSO|nr:cytochrome c biogenesis protein [Porphyridium sordidum]AOM66493.1 cytochrome c biogenesis protein [Porphyridium sordidum]
MNIEIQNNLINIAFVMSLIAMLFYLTQIIFDIDKKNIGLLLTIGINFSLGIMLTIRWIKTGYFPLSNLYESLVFLTWCITALHITTEYKTGNRLIGAITSPVAMFTLGFSSLSLPSDMKKVMPLVPALKSNWLMMHVSIMMLSYSALIIGSLLAILFLVLSKGKDVNIQGSSIGNDNYNTKIMPDLNHNSGFSSNNLSLLESLDNLSYRTIGLGFPLLTIGIIAGAVWANSAWGSYWSWDPKETWALITWLIFAAYLHARITKSWQGKKPAILASIGFIIVWICYLGVNFLGQGLHSYGWLA